MNIVQIMVMEGMEKKKRDEFEAQLWMTGEEARAAGETRQRRTRAILAEEGDIG